MRVLFNAIPLRPGGGLTVLIGLLDGLRRLPDGFETVVICRHQATCDAVVKSGAAHRVEARLTERGDLTASLWQHTRLGTWARDNAIDALVTFNHRLRNIECPQVVYHVNLRRFAKIGDVRNPIERCKEWLRDIAAQQAIQLADVNVFESQYLREQAVLRFPTPRQDLQVSYIGLPDDLVDRAVQSEDTYQGHPDLAAITSPFSHKDNSRLVRIVHELVRREPTVPWKLNVAGGSEESWVTEKRLAADLGVSSRIQWLGFCDQATLDRLLRRSLCLVAPSLLESFAMVAVEAMARRCPPVVANTAAMPESVGNAGLLAQPGDEADFAQAVIRLYRNPELRDALVRAGIDRVRLLRWSRCGQDFGGYLRGIAA